MDEFHELLISDDGEVTEPRTEIGKKPLAWNWVPKSRDHSEVFNHLEDRGWQVLLPLRPDPNGRRIVYVRRK